MTNEIASTRELSNWYYTLACVMVLFGFLGLLSIGAPFLTLGIAMFCLAPLAKRGSPLVLPVLVAIATFWAVLFALGPVTCSESVVRSELREGRRHPVEISTVCDQQPDAFAIATVTATGIGLGSWVVVRSRAPT